MKNEWNVSCNVIGDVKKYIVYRLIDKDVADHTGNRETYGKYTENGDEAIALAKRLNTEDTE